MNTLTKLTVGDNAPCWAEPKSNVKHGDDFCTVCGKKMGKNGFYLHLSIEGTILPLNYTGEESYSQGCWSVGSECAKQFDASVLGKAAN